MRILALQALAYLALQACYGQTAPAPAAVSIPPGVEIKVRAQPQKATIGDPIEISFEIALPSGYQAILPKLGSQLGDFAILRYFPGPAVPSEGTVLAPPAAASASAPNRHLARVEVAIYKTGEFEFPSLPITLRAPGGKESEVSTQPVKIQIQSVLVDKNPQLKELKKQAEIQEPVRWLLWLALAFLLVIVAFLAWWLYRRRRRPAPLLPSRPQVDPLVLAEADLRDLGARGLLEKGLIKQFYVLLSDIVKRILEAGYAIHTIEKTSSEIMEELRQRPAADQAVADLELIESVLVECDLVKFAKFVPSRAESDSILEDSFRILESARKLRSVPAAEGATTAAGVS